MTSVVSSPTSLAHPCILLAVHNLAALELLKLLHLTLDSISLGPVHSPLEHVCDPPPYLLGLHTIDNGIEYRGQ